MTLHHLVETLALAGQAWPDAPSLLHSLQRDWTLSERRGWLNLLRRTYGESTLKAAWAIFGRNATLDDLAKLQTHATAWLSRIADGPRLAPLLQSHVRVMDVPPADLQGLRSGLLRRGLLPSSWKWLCRQQRDVVRKLTAFGWSPEAIFWVNLLAKARTNNPMHPGWLEAGRPYMLAPHYEATQAGSVEGDADAALQLQRFLRLTPPEPDAIRLREYEVIAQGMLAALYDSDYPVRVEHNATWRALLERQRRYQQERLKKAESLELEPGQLVEWTPRFGELQLYGVNIRELTTTLDLAKEGVILTHCVGDGAYTSGCMNGVHIIASLEEPVSGMRATLQLVKNKHGANGWHIGQLAGIGNGRVPQFFWKAGRELQQRLAA